MTLEVDGRVVHDFDGVPAPFDPPAPAEARDMAVAAIRLLTSALEGLGWRKYKASERISPDGQLAIRTGYSGAQTYVEAKRLDQTARDQHVADETTWWVPIHPMLQVTGREPDGPLEAVSAYLTECGIPVWGNTP